MRYRAPALVGLILALSILILLVGNRLIASQNIPFLTGTPPLCNDGPGPHIASRFVDLDPSIDMESKIEMYVKRLDGQYEMVFASTEEQMNNYFKTLRVGECWLGAAPPTCMMGHYPGEPPGRKPCTVPTPKGTTPVPNPIIKRPDM
jgi:hypothetical protein